MSAWNESFYRIFIGEKYIHGQFESLEVALRFANKHKSICPDCKDKPVRILLVKIATETEEVYIQN